MTDAGRDWVIQTLDPFHDTQRHKAGFPDVTNGNSFIQMVTLTESFAVVQPTDFHVFTLPQANKTSYFQYPMYDPVTVDPGQAVGIGTLGPLNVIAGVPGMYSMPWIDELGAHQPATAGNNIFAFDLMPYMIGESRVVSFGFEVINTGPELLKSGALTSYRSPQTIQTSFLRDSTRGENGNYLPIRRSGLVPATASEALLLYGSQQWEAYDGSYNVSTMTEVSNPATSGDFRDHWYITGNQTQGPDSKVGYGIGPGYELWFPNLDNKPRPIPFNSVGSFIQGAAAGTTITVVLRAYIECFPTPDLKSYVTLTDPSTPYDPKALELYSRASNHLKPAVKQSANPAGEYWDMVKGVLEVIAPRVHVIAQAGDVLYRDVRSAIEKNRDKKKNVDDQTKNYGKQQTKNTKTVDAVKRQRARKGR